MREVTFDLHKKVPIRAYAAKRKLINQSSSAYFWLFGLVKRGCVNLFSPGNESRSSKRGTKKADILAILITSIPESTTKVLQSAQWAQFL